MKYGAALTLAGALTSVQAQRLDTGFLTGPELTALAGGNFAWGDIEIGDTNIMSLDATIQFDALTRLANCSAPGGRIEYLNDATGPTVETDIRTQVTFVLPLEVYGKNCQFIFFLGNTSTVTGSGRFTVLQNETPTQQRCTTTSIDPVTIPMVEQEPIGTYQARFADLAEVVTSAGTFLVGTNAACPPPGTYTTPPPVVNPPTVPIPSDP
ncbi:hypothetical protein QBC32DRAFT_372315 [Pseudoneurospora amorphoporcata]|uniref:Ubiquitin 3 binding protein But2 C-terminal domain-containing protein n=1 Tax=Pseudoneurospora amorphoporcata TaxID=241081 RepID=A0AAN6NQ74_9PEZI|nr:hypothetical protein QBC32DRAFT_372315 [Pseudoneurospora amorphoporcata]